MNWVDLVIVAVIAWLTFRAYQNGLIREVVTLGAVVLGVVFAGLFYDNLAEALEFLVDSATTRALVAFILIFAAVIAAGQVAAVMLKTTATLMLMGPMDHVGGAIFGFIKGLILVQVILIALAVYPAIDFVSRGIDDSSIAAFFLDTIPFAGVGLPSAFDQPMEQLEEWRRQAGAFTPSTDG